MSGLRAKLSEALHRSPSPSPRNSVDLSHETDKYRLLITAGPTYDPSTHKIVHVNTDTPTYIEGEFVRANIKVRIRGFRGLPSTSPSSSPYFDDSVHEKDQYSVAASFVPKKDLPSQDVVWGNDFDHPVRERLPPGFNTAFKIVKDWIDPGLECDAYADEPWLYGPALSCWFGFRIGDKLDDNAELPSAAEPQDILREGADGTGNGVRNKHGLPDSNEKRRKHFLSKAHREPFVFEKDRLYSLDFYNPYLDFGNFSLKLPGFSINVIKYIDDKSHTLRYVLKNRQTGDIYFCINFNLLWGEKLQKALRDDDEQIKALAGAETDGIESDGVEEQKPSESEDSKPNGESVLQHQDNAANKENVRYDPAKSTSNSGPVASKVGNTSTDEPGLKDKPDWLREQVQGMSISDTLKETSTGDGRNRKALHNFDELD